ncbi:hypothetical protein KC19_VG240000 [Ceratodon purpureus]|uniref:Uncharacterized protein n=1 Tax=Ceratodon purpureus TaxID=3225 RepID=A0A8T0HTP8_CERPU|nr:hypothetical protein KC19_VG238200 [Ceratodon purpureus]KAG0574167.1 hypothetical protein KC19_VG240000 [Ceratodon purpureus]
MGNVIVVAATFFSICMTSNIKEVTFVAQHTISPPKPSYLTRICMEKTSIY